MNSIKLGQPVYISYFKPLNVENEEGRKNYSRTVGEEVGCGAILAAVAYLTKPQSIEPRSL